MKNVWLICGASITEDGNKTTGRYPFNSEYKDIIAICDSMELAAEFANEHMARCIKEAKDFYNDEGVNIIMEEATTEELKNGIEWMSIVDPIEPHDKTCYYIKIKEQMVLER